MWTDLHRDILAEFACVSRLGDIGAAFRSGGGFGVISPDECRPPRTDAERERRQRCKHLRLRRRRIAEATTRPPCPHCKGPVTRLGTTGALPKYCSWECMQAEKLVRRSERLRAA